VRFPTTGQADPRSVRRSAQAPPCR
jgi:hypothetical protein